MPKPQGLEPPCDTDYGVLTEEECGEYPAEFVSTLQCDTIDDTYLGTVGKISDTRCPGEDRLLQCELLGGVANTNILEDSRAGLLKDAFLKSYVTEKVGIFSRFS